MHILINFLAVIGAITLIATGLFIIGMMIRAKKDRDESHLDEHGHVQIDEEDENGSDQ